MKKKLLLFCFSLCYLILLQYLYSHAFQEQYNYQGFEFNFNFQYFCLGVLLLGILIACKKVKYSPSFIFTNLAVTLIFIPTIVLDAGQGLSIKTTLITFFSLILIGLPIKYNFPRSIKSTKLSFNTVVLLVMLISGIVLSAIYLYVGSSFNLDFLRVYEFRRDVGARLPLLFAYLINSLPKAFIPLAICICLTQRSKISIFGVIYFLTASFLLFGLTHHKAPLLYPLIAIMLYYFARLRQINIATILLLTLCAVVGIFESFFSFDSKIITSLVFHRGLIVPSWLNHLFIDKFNTIHYFWSSSKITFGLVPKPFELNPPNLIGEYFFGNPDVSANTGWIGSGYAQAGFLGVIFYSILINLLFSYLDRMSFIYGVPLIVGSSSVLILTLLISADMTDMLITHGLLLYLIALSLLPLRSKSRVSSVS